MKVGVVGLGYWGSKVVEEYVALRDDGEIAGVVACDADPSKLSAVDDVDARHESLDDALPAVEALHVCTNNATHYPIAEQALTAGKDVLVEKPLTTDRKRAYDLVELASESGGILQSGHIFRFANVVRRVRDLFDEGYFGDVYDVSLRWTHRMEPTEQTNVLWDLLPHPIDILNFVTDEWPDDVRGIGANHRNGTLESAHAQFRLGEATATVQVSWVDYVRRRTLEIAGSERSARVECVDQTIEVFDGDGRESIPVETNNTIRTEAENLVTAVRTRENTFNSAIVGARTVDAIQSIAESVET